MILSTRVGRVAPSFLLCAVVLLTGCGDATISGTNFAGSAGTPGFGGSDAGVGGSGGDGLAGSGGTAGSGGLAGTGGNAGSAGNGGSSGSGGSAGGGGGAPAGDGNEARCIELADACVCSEPLNVNQDLSGSRFQNPADTTTKECDGERGNGLAVTLPYLNDVVLGETVRASSAGGAFPSGADPWVWAMSCRGIHHIQANTVYGLDEGTTCIRGYQRFSSDLRAPASVGAYQERIKVQGLGGGFDQGTFTVGSEVDPFGSGDLVVKFVSSQYNVNHGTAFSDVVGKCKSNWCRFESCVDQIGDRITMRFRWNVVGTSEVHTEQVTSEPGPGVLQDLNFPQSAILFCQGDTTGTQYSSHNMQATTFPADSNFWIGPAYELEGQP